MQSEALGGRGPLENLGLRLNASLAPRGDGAPAGSGAGVAHLGTSVPQSRVTFIGTLSAVRLHQCQHRD